MLYWRRLNQIVARWQALIGIAFSPTGLNSITCAGPVQSGAPEINSRINP
jgi:hypothetical protein